MAKMMAPQVTFRYRQPMFISLVQHGSPEATRLQAEREASQAYLVRKPQATSSILVYTGRQVCQALTERSNELTQRPPYREQGQQALGGCGEELKEQSLQRVLALNVNGHQGIS